MADDIPPPPPPPAAPPYPLPADRLRGSLMRCLMLTSGSAAQVAGRLETMAAPHVVVPPDAVFMPRGFRYPVEARLGVSPEFLTASQRSELVEWWLADGFSVPNWDIVSTCQIEGRPGLLLVEAKAHWAEVKVADACGSTHAPNCERIAQAISQANTGLNSLLPGWGLQANSHYQLCNRFAWAWELASMGVPVVLVYLGFLNADEMADNGRSFTSLRDWAECVRATGRLC